MKIAVALGLIVISAAVVLGSGGSARADSIAASIQVQTNKTPVAVPPGVFGQNVLGVDEYGTDAGGLWDPDAASCAPQVKGCFASDVMDLVRHAGVGSLRFPGGMDSRRYDWRRGVGDPAVRDVAFGSEEFLFLADALGASPILTVSAYDGRSYQPGTPDAVALAAGWVEYANATSGEYADLRRASGHPDPHGVRYWEVDSETWDAHADPFNANNVYPALSPRTYAESFVRFARAMKAVDPAIQLGAVAYENVDDTDLTAFLDWFVENDPDPDLWPDFLVLQYYRPTFDSRYCDLEGSAYADKLAEYGRATMAAALQFRGRVQSLRKEVAEHWAAHPERARGIWYAVTEWGTWFHYADVVTDGGGEILGDACPFKELRFSLLAALYGADMLMQLAGMGADVPVADAWNLADDSATARPWKVGNVTRNCGVAAERPAESAFRMLSKDFALRNLVPTQVQSPTVDSPSVTRISDAVGILPGPDEAYLRIRLTRPAEPINPADYCGPNDSRNLDPGSWIRGKLDLDDVRVYPEGFLRDPTTNLLTNGDFENGLAGWKTGAAAPGTRGTRVCEDGRCFFRLAFDGGAGNPAIQAALTQTIPIQPGTRYILSAKIRARGMDVKTRNMLCDSGFDFTGPERGPFANSYWEQYDCTPAPATLATDTFVSGPKSVRVPFWGNPNYWHLEQPVFLHHDADPLLSDPPRYFLRAWMKAESMHGPGMVEAQQRDFTGQAVAAAEPIGLYGTTDWQRVERRFRLKDPENTNLITFHLRRKDLAVETGGAMVYDSLGLFRDPIEYAPKLAVDLCSDPACANPRTVTVDTVLGDADWTDRGISGTPALAALSGREGDILSLVVLNRDLSDALATRIDLAGWDGGPRDVWIGELRADSIDATNEACDGSPTPGARPRGVTDGRPVFWKTLSEGSFDYAFPPHSLTAFRFVRPGSTTPTGAGTAEAATWPAGSKRRDGNGCGCDLGGSGRSNADAGAALVLLLVTIGWGIRRAAKARVEPGTRRPAVTA